MKESRTRTSKRLAKALGRLGQKKGEVAEVKFECALLILEKMGLGVKFIKTETGSHKDKQGIDFEIFGTKGISFHFAIDVKSSVRKVEKYRRKKARARKAGNGHKFNNYALMVEESDSPKQAALKFLKIFLKEIGQKSLVARIPWQWDTKRARRIINKAQKRTLRGGG